MATAAQRTELETPRTRARRPNPPTIRAGSARGHGRRPDAYAGQPDSAPLEPQPGPRREPPRLLTRAGRNSFDTTPRQGGLPSGLVKPPPIDTEPPTPRRGRSSRSKDEDDDNRSDAGSVASMASVEGRPIDVRAAAAVPLYSKRLRQSCGKGRLLPELRSQ